jgi:phage virion morphogenesis protein
MIRHDIPVAIAQLDAMLARILNPEPAFAVIGAAQREAIQRRIQRTKVDPEGDAWSPWRPRTQEHRERKGNAGQGLLWDDGTLLESIAYDSSASGVLIGTDVSYAGYLQDGTQKMDARPFLGWTDDDAHRGEMTMLHYIEGVL